MAVGANASYAASPDSVRIERLAAVGRLWGALKLFHPYLAYRRVSWDSALVATIPRIEAATDRASFSDAVQVMLGALADSLTRVVRAEAPPPPSLGEPHPLSRFEPDSILVVTMRRYWDLTDFFTARKRMDAIAALVPRSSGVVFDLRSEYGQGSISWAWTVSLDRALSIATAVAPGVRTRIHSGLAPPASFAATSGDYYSAWRIRDARAFRPRAGVRARPIVFVLNGRTGLPDVALALQRAGQATLVSEGSPSDALLVPTTLMGLTDSVSVAVRLGERIDSEGRVGLVADTVVSAPENSGADDPALRVALAWARTGHPVSRRLDAQPAGDWAPRDSAYSTMPYPDREYRLLAAFRIWTYMEYFHAYRGLYDRDWGAVLEESLPRFEAARDSTEYALAIAAMVREVHDTHAFINSPDLQEFRGVAPSPVRVRMIEGQPVVTRVLADSAARASGVAVGDVVLSVDGVSIRSRIQRLAPTFAASTPQSLDNQVSQYLLNGPDSSRATVVVRGVSGRSRTVTLTRSNAFWSALQDERVDAVLRLLPGNIGYADLDRLTPGQVDSMFVLFRDTRGIIFDMRGYPNGTAWSIAPRLTDRDELPAALFRRPIATVPHGATSGLVEREILEFTQTLPRTFSSRYHGRTVMLIDERTISQAEHTGLFFEAANGTKFIGTPTTGANGDVTSFLLPGGNSVSLSGHDVRHADGRQLQRVGLKPHIRVAPTLSGIRAGRDEVLDKSIEYLRGAAQKPDKRTGPSGQRAR